MKSIEQGFLPRLKARAKQIYAEGRSALALPVKSFTKHDKRFSGVPRELPSTWSIKGYDPKTQILTYEIAGDKPIRIATGGCGGEESEARTLTYGAIAASDTDVLIYIGDLLYKDGYRNLKQTRTLLKEFIDDYPKPIFPILGNHEHCAHGIAKPELIHGMAAVEHFNRLYQLPTDEELATHYYHGIERDNPLKLNEIIKDKKGTELPKIVKPENYFAIRLFRTQTGHSTYCICLDSTTAPYDYKQQKWLVKLLEAIKSSDKNFKLLFFFHHPLTTYNPKRRKSLDREDCELYARHANYNKKIEKKNPATQKNCDAFDILNFWIEKITANATLSDKKPSYPHNKIFKYWFYSCLNQVKGIEDNIVACFSAHDHQALIKQPTKKSFTLVTQGSLGGHLQSQKVLEKSKSKVFYAQNKQHGYSVVELDATGQAVIEMRRCKGIVSRDEYNKETYYIGDMIDKKVRLPLPKVCAKHPHVLLTPRFFDILKEHLNKYPLKKYIFWGKIKLEREHAKNITALNKLIERYQSLLSLQKNSLESLTKDFIKEFLEYYQENIHGRTSLLKILIEEAFCDIFRIRRTHKKMNFGTTKDLLREMLKDLEKSSSHTMPSTQPRLIKKTEGSLVYPCSTIVFSYKPDKKSSAIIIERRKSFIDIGESFCGDPESFDKYSGSSIIPGS